ncbi:MAG: hypothetical protein U0P81_12520 [Holophagaceae bacterium]
MLRLRSSALCILSCASPWSPAQAPKSPTPKPATLAFQGTTFHLRWSKDGQFEFTPAGQEDLQAWTEMVTVWRYPAVKDGEALAGQANRTLGAYKGAQGRILRTNSTPRTAAKPAEHFIAAFLGGPSVLEFTAARFVLVDGQGAAVIYSRRAYGKPAKPDLGPWVSRHGAEVEQKLMAFDLRPVLAALPR